MTEAHAVRSETTRSDDRGPDAPGEISAGGWKNTALSTWRQAGEDNLELISAGVAFYIFLAFVPLLAAFVLSYGLIADPAAVVGHMATLTSIMPQNAAEIIGEQLLGMVESASTTTGFALLLALGISLYGAMRGATAIMTALNIVYARKETRGFVKRSLIALAMTVGGVVTLFVAILAVSVLNFAETLLPDVAGVVHLTLRAGFLLLSAASVIVLIAIIYRQGPDRPDAPWRWITPGSAIATILWLAATSGFGVYVANFGNYNATYGSLGAVIVFLTWLYLSAYIVLMGAELNSELERQAGRL